MRYWRAPKSATAWGTGARTFAALIEDPGTFEQDVRVGGQSMTQREAPTRPGRRRDGRSSGGQGDLRLTAQAVIAEQLVGGTQCVGRASCAQSYEAVIYEAARYPIAAPVMRTVRIEDPPKAPVSGISTLVVLPRELVTADMAMVNRLGIPDDYVVKKSEHSASAIPRAAQDPPT